ncbi:MAG: hypothetical protein HQK52_11900 [Oligoflexia bacterium]|nr:hypothetical protein [Oligoflexia bacterium]
MKIVLPTENYLYYLFQYYSRFFRNLLFPKFSRTRAHQSFPPSYTGIYSFTDKTINRWYRLFELDRKHAPWINFPYFCPATIILFFELLSDLNIRFKDMLFARWNIHRVSPGVRFLAHKQYQISITASALKALTKTSIILCCTTEIKDPHSNESIAHATSFFKIKNRHNFYKDLLKRYQNQNQNLNSPLLSSYSDHLFLGLSQQKATITPTLATHSCDFFIPENMGLKFGRVSGDFSITHTTHFTARLFGFPKAFIQGLCIGSYLIKHITLKLQQPITSLEVYYCNQVYVNQCVRLNFKRSSTQENFYYFEIVDELKRLLVKGSFSTEHLQMTA